MYMLRRYEVKKTRVETIESERLEMTRSGVFAKVRTGRYGQGLLCQRRLVFRKSCRTYQSGVLYSVLRQTTYDQVDAVRFNFEAS